MSDFSVVMNGYNSFSAQPNVLRKGQIFSQDACRYDNKLTIDISAPNLPKASPGPVSSLSDFGFLTTSRCLDTAAKHLARLKR